MSKFLFIPHSTCCKNCAQKYGSRFKDKRNPSATLVTPSMYWFPICTEQCEINNDNPFKLCIRKTKYHQKREFSVTFFCLVNLHNVCDMIVTLSECKYIYIHSHSRPHFFRMFYVFAYMYFKHEAVIRHCHDPQPKVIKGRQSNNYKVWQDYCSYTQHFLCPAIDLNSNILLLNIYSI